MPLFPCTNRGGSTVQRHHTTLNRFSSAIRGREGRVSGVATKDTVSSKLVEPGREERATRVETTPHPKSQNPTPNPQTCTRGFDTTSSQSSQVGSTSFGKSKAG